MSRRIRVLLLAEACTPERISVPLVGWQIARSLRGVANVHLVTHARNGDALRRAGLDETDMTLIDPMRLDGMLREMGGRLRGGSDKGWTTVAAFGALAYYRFEQLVWKRFGTALERGEYDVVHRVTPLSPSAQSPLARRCPVPFVLGPINGGLPWPREFRSQQHAEGEWLSYVRQAYRLLPCYRSTLRCSAAILAGSRHVARQLPYWCRSKTIYLPENGIDPTSWRVSELASWRTVETSGEPVGDRKPATPGLNPETCNPSPHTPRPAPHPTCNLQPATCSPKPQTPNPRPQAPTCTALFVGRLVPLKGTDLFLEAAIPLMQQGLLRTVIVGDGPERPRLETLVRRSGIEQCVRFTGWVPQAEVRHHLHHADLMVFPSIRDFGGGAVLEAMATGLPSLVVDYGGPGELVTPQTGIRVPMGNRESVVREMRSALCKLASNPAFRRRLGAQAAQRAGALFTWETKARQIQEVYRWVLGRRTERPDFGFFADSSAPLTAERTVA